MNYKNKIYDYGDAKVFEIIENWKKNGQKIVFTNGCFDLLHSGHIQYLNEAKEYGDKLVIGLNSDASVRRLKGKGRPVKSQECRADILASMSAVDLVIIFDEDTPLTLIGKILPGVLVKGGDWKPQDIVGYDIVMKNGGEVKSLSFLDGYSTTAILKRAINIDDAS